MTPAQQASLKQKLDELHIWPSVYMFKFVVENQDEKVQELLGFFSETADVKLKKSSKGKYTSVTIKEAMVSADAVVKRYLELRVINGLISL